MENSILFHVGMPKTGTSSLQKFLVMNQKILNENYWCYPDSRMNFRNRDVTLEGRWCNGGLYPFILNQRCHQNNWKNTFKIFIKSIDANIQKYNVILSEESLWFDIEGIEFLRYMKKIYSNIKIIVYLRSWDAEIESLHAQLVKNLEGLYGLNKKECIMTLDEFYQNAIIKTSRIGTIFDYYNKLEQYSKIVGQQNLFVYTYEEAKQKGICKHFIESLYLDFNQFQEITKVNITPSTLETEVMRRMNKTFIHQPDSILRLIASQYQKILVPES